MSIIDPIRRVARLKMSKPRRAADEDARIPPGQYRAEKLPVLSYGPTPLVDLASWKLRVTGLVESPLVLSWGEFTSLPAVRTTVDIHCVTRWSRLDTAWKGVPFATILEMARPLSGARFVMQHSYGGYTTNLPLDELTRENVLLAYELDGAPLSVEHGGPMRLVVPQLYFWKSAKWLQRLEFLAEDEPGFWERYGYHNHGDPWREERFR